MSKLSKIDSVSGQGLLAPFKWAKSHELEHVEIVGIEVPIHGEAFDWISKKIYQKLFPGWNIFNRAGNKKIFQTSVDFLINELKSRSIENPSRKKIEEYGI